MRRTMYRILRQDGWLELAVLAGILACIYYNWHV